jgi:sec-independent protein translocase protein TatB
MLDIGFSEILLIFALALVVLGPEKLPKVAAQVGRWMGRARGMARQFREQLEEEVNLEEVRKSRPPVMTSDPSPAVAPPQEVTTSTPPAVTATPAPAESQPTDTEAAWKTSPPAEVSPGTAIAPGTSADVAEAAPQAEPEQPVYPDGYSHAHPTDSLGRPLEPTHEPAAVDSGQQDWVGGVTTTDKAAQTTPAAAYAPSHERGT